MGKFLGMVLAITAAFAVYKLAVQPMVDSALKGVK
jgi:hypothetical protein